MKKKIKKNVTFTIFFTILLQLMLSTRLLQPIVDGKKKIIIMIFSNRKQKVA